MIGTKLKAAWRERFLRYREGGNTETEALARLGVGRSFLYQEMRRDPDFDKRVKALSGLTDVRGAA